MKEKQDLGSLLPQRTLVKGVGHTKTHAECWLQPSEHRGPSGRGLVSMQENVCSQGSTGSDPTAQSQLL